MPCDLDLPHRYDSDCACEHCHAARAHFVEGCEEMWLDLLAADLTLDQDLFGGDGAVFGEVA